MSIIVYNKALTNFHEITHAISINMIEYYNAIGSVEINLPIDEYNIEAIENGGVIYDSERGMSFTIQSHKYNTVKNRITINGYTCNWLLNNRVLAQKTSIRNVEESVYSAVSNNLRGLPHVDVAQAQGFPEEADSLFYGGQVLTKLMPTLDEAKIGQRMVWDDERKKHIFTLYKGRDLTQGIHSIVFSEERGTAKDLVISLDDSTFFDVIYVQATLDDDNDTEIIEVVGNQNGEHREFWLRETLRQDDEETEAALRERMRQRGMEEMAERLSRHTFSVTIDTEEYGKFYQLGDIVSCVSIRFGVTLTSRITGVKYTLDAYGEKVSLTLGDPILTVLGEVKLNYGRN